MVSLYTSDYVPFMFFAVEARARRGKGYFSGPESKDLCIGEETGSSA